MNVLRLPRVWASPIARLCHGTRSITTSSLLAPETAPNVFRRTDKSTSIFQTSFLRTLATEASSSAEATPEVATSEVISSEASASIPPPPPRNPKAAHLPYQIEKTKSGNLPVYEIHAAGRVKSTAIRKIRGDQKALADDLRKALKLKDFELRSNELTSKIEVAGKRVADVRKFLRAQGLGEDFTPLSSNQ
ncbi:uncharacterized protein DFL_006397 [Arthrobotrys flagrans]|uniref:Large ribosomal subunit protein mL49 n=1 Tax=Arthrobotrys flagrans TaxID=97331 RepID=A0A437A0Z6_ARTFL|nr:hypothetical protein DFL_006397 [Arthrobotrys flagrans]